jgi:heat shock protein HslJ
MSTDGAHYISAIFKLNTALFPATTPANFDASTFTTYVQQSVTTLNSAQPTDFTPSLAMFDAVIQSFSFAPSPAQPIVPPTVPPAANTDPTFGGLTQSNWVLATYGTAEAPITALPQAPINLIFTQDGISGSSGCNTYFGQFKYDIHALSFSGIGSTLIACTDPAVMTQETDYLNALRTATSYEIDNGVLKITYQSGVLTFNGGTVPVVVTATPVVGGNANLGGLAGVNWVLSSFGPASAPVAVLPGSSVTAVFTTEGVSGSAGCNSYSGTFQFDNTNLTFSPLITTKMACTDNNIMTQETTYLTALQSVTSYQINNGQLQLAYPDGLLTFNANTATPTPAVSLTSTPFVNTDSTLGGLAGVHWTLVSYGATAAPVAALPDSPITADFTAQGVSGSAGCNQYSGNFVYNNGSLTFSPLVTTQKACADNLMAQESAYLKALQSATAYQIAGGQLTIAYPDGVLVFKSGA